MGTKLARLDAMRDAKELGDDDADAVARAIVDFRLRRLTEKVIAQVNERGSWRDVLTNVETHQQLPVMEAVVSLHNASGGTRFRLFDVKSQKVLAYCEGGCWSAR